MIEVYHIGDSTGKPVGILPCRTEDVPSFPRDYYHVATLDIPDSRMSDVFALTNHIDIPWCENPEVVSYPAKDLRSTSVNDVIKLSDGTIWRCMPSGWQEFRLSEWENQTEIKKRRWDQQCIMAKEINQAGFNIVTCGSCGHVMLHRIGDEEIECPHCGFTSEPCDFPDLFIERSLEDFKSLER